MAWIALLGYGTVGTGLVEVLSKNQQSIDKRAQQPIRIKHIFTRRDYPGDPMQKLITHDYDDILRDSDVSVVVEAMGGIEPAYTFAKKALMQKKSFVTSNKELVAKHGAELLELARENNLNFLFEASVGGGIPIIRPLNSSLTADEIRSIEGILNGTTNYILTKMDQDGQDFDTVLKKAQDLGYAEKDPTADVGGHDACRKLSILLSLAMGKQVDFEQIYTEGITDITLTDMAYAKEMDCMIKLLASASIVTEGVYAMVSPRLVKIGHPLSMVNDVFNAIFVNGNVIGDVMFYGRGAGKLPTASAVAADVVDAVKNSNRNILHFWSTEKLQILPMAHNVVKKLVRIQYNRRDKAMLGVRQIFGDVAFIEIHTLENEIGFVTKRDTEQAIDEKCAVLLENPAVASVVKTIRMEAV